MAKRPTNIAGMAQSNREIPVSVVARDAQTGRFVVVKGASSMASQVLQIKKGVDLTKPIARQVLGKSKPKRVAKG